MPVRSSSSSALRWPDRHEVEGAVLNWAGALARSRPDVLVYTPEELSALGDREGRFASMLAREVVWVFERSDAEV